MKLIEEINRLKKERNAVILAHNYQRPEIQNIADFVGDSLGLSEEAKRTNADVIVFCGVDFMAETAATLNPEKTVLIPDLSAICPMAMMLTPEKIIKAKKKYPTAQVVLYVNSSAESKAMADCVCTSANADKVVNSMTSDTVIFGPDKNLGYYVKKRSSKKIVCIPEEGVCPTHHQISKEDIVIAREKHPKAKFIAHPEVIPEVQEISEYIASTEGMIEYCRNSQEREFIIGTENGIINRLKRECPGKEFYPVSDSAICPPMKMITLRKLRDSLKEMKFKIKIPEEVSSMARDAINCMLKIR